MASRLIPIYVEINSGITITNKDVAKIIQNHYRWSDPDMIIEPVGMDAVEIKVEKKFTDITLEGEIYRRLEKKAKKQGKNVLKMLEDLVAE